MAFLDQIEMIDGERLSQTAKATVQSTGRLNFTPETAAMMNITAESTVILFKAGHRDLGAIVKPGDDRRGFKVKKTGPYFYLQLKNYFDERGINYKDTSVRIVYDITRLDEEYEGLPLFKLNRRDIVHDPKVQDAPEALKTALGGVSEDEATESTSKAQSASEGPENA